MVVSREPLPQTFEYEANETVIVHGGPVKAIEETEGRVGGYVVLFSGADDPDLQGDFFTKDTDFGILTHSAVLWHHGKDKTIGTKSIGVVEIKADEVGVWAEGVLNLRNKYEKAIYEMVKAGKLGWSTGTAAHLVKREPVKNANRVLSWPLGVDTSLTPNPAEPRTMAIPIKSIGEADIEALMETKSMLHDSLSSEMRKELGDLGYLEDLDNEYAYVQRVNGDITAHKYKEKDGKLKVDKEGKKARRVRSYILDDETKSFTLAQESAMVLATCESFVSRLESLKSLRLAEGGDLTAKSYEDIDHLLTLLEKLKQPAPNTKSDADESPDDFTDEDELKTMRAFALAELALTQL